MLALVYALAAGCGALVGWSSAAHGSRHPTTWILASVLGGALAQMMISVPPRAPLLLAAAALGGLGAWRLSASQRG
ncbi:MAG: hypothetical protein AAF682_13135 [Planctomycetota bacterium]